MSGPISIYIWTLLAGSVVIPVGLCLYHLVKYGPARIQSHSAILNILRFNRWERAMHWVRLISFIAVILSGISLGMKGASGRIGAGIHEPAANLFLLASIIALLFCIKDMLPSSRDREWLAGKGGYFTPGRPSYPSGRFNAGQKISFWLSMALIIIAYASGDSIRGGGSVIKILHITSGKALLAIVMFHAYLSTFANPGTLGVILHGKVSEKWARHHHPMWQYKKID